MGWKHAVTHMVMCCCYHCTVHQVIWLCRLQLLKEQNKNVTEYLRQTIMISSIVNIYVNTFSINFNKLWLWLKNKMYWQPTRGEGFTESNLRLLSIIWSMNVFMNGSGLNKMYWQPTGFTKSNLRLLSIKWSMNVFMNDWYQFEWIVICIRSSQFFFEETTSKLQLS